MFFIKKENFHTVYYIQNFVHLISFHKITSLILIMYKFIDNFDFIKKTRAFIDLIDYFIKTL